jgi:hypothetical protein
LKGKITASADKNGLRKVFFEGAAAPFASICAAYAGHGIARAGRRMRLEVAAKPPGKAGIACANTPLPPLLLKISHADDERKRC